MAAQIAVLPGDGVGPEVTEVALSVLTALVAVDIRHAPIGGAAIDATGDPLPPETLALCGRSTAVLLGAVGGPKWEAGPRRPEEGLLGLRQALGVYANLRPARYMGLVTPLRDELVRHADILVVRDLAGGVYFGEPRGVAEGLAYDTWWQTEEETSRVAHMAFRLARKRRFRVTSVDKANVLESSRLWRRVVSAVAEEYPDVALEHRYIDAMAFEMLRVPHHFDVLVTDNLFGDILSDEAAAVAGSIGLLPSASLGPGPGLFQPVHGSSPEIAGRGIANPTGAILAVALLLEHALGRSDLARAVESAVAAALREVRTPDIGGDGTTAEFAQAVHRNLSWARWAEETGREQRAVADWGV